MNEDSIFTAALAKGTPAERAAYLDEACASNPALRAQVEELLKASEGAGSFLDQPALGTAATVAPTQSSGPASLPPLESCHTPGRIGKLDHYEIIELVGHGGMGVVLRAVDTKLNRVVAVKVMSAALAANPGAVKRFLREAKAAAAIHHDNVVTIHAVGDAHQPPYLVMEFIEGETLQRKIERNGALSLTEILRIGSQMAAGLAAAHKHGLIHRDVKPANILLENSVERVKITDFGLARTADDVEMTQSGLIAGTPQYMSPEQALSEPIDYRSDLFSLGSVLYTMCTGRPAFRADSTVAILRRVCDDTPRPIRDVNPEIPEWLTQIVERLLAKNPQDRVQSADEVAALLGEHLAASQQPAAKVIPRSASRPAAAPASWRRRWVAIAAALVIVIGLLTWRFGFAVALYTQGHAIIRLESNDSDARLEIRRFGQLDPTANRLGNYRVGGRFNYEVQVVPPPGKRVDHLSFYHQTLFTSRFDPSIRTTPREIYVGVGDYVKLTATLVDAPEAEATRTSNSAKPERTAELATRFPPGSSADILTSDEWEWTEPENLGPVINSTYREDTPSISADGLAILFLSNRPSGVGGTDLWMSERSSIDNPWSKPFNLQAPVNSPDGEGSPTISTNGLSLVFDRWIKGRDSDLYWTNRTSKTQAWQTPLRLDAPVNLTSNEFQPNLSSNELVLLFSSNRAGGFGSGDLWMSSRSSTSDAWSSVKNLGPNVNSDRGEFCPFLAFDQLTLLFSMWEDRAGDLMLSSRATIRDGWLPRIKLSSVINSPANDTYPCLSVDSRMLLFASDRSGGHGDRDLWMSRRVRKTHVAPISPPPTAPPAKRFPPGSSADILTSDEWEWTPPQNLGSAVNSEQFDSDPFLSTGGESLLFYSQRTRDLGDIWISRKSNSGDSWLPPVSVRLPSAGGAPNLSSDGLTLLFNRKDYDTNIYLATRASPIHPWQSPTKLDSPVNSTDHDHFPWLSNDERTLLFTSNRPGGQGGADLWMCRRLSNTHPWSKAENLGAAVNSSSTDESPCLAADGLALLYTTHSSGSADVVICTRPALDCPWSNRAPLGSSVNSSAIDCTPCLSRDYQTLIFSSDRPGGIGKRDLWMSRRVKTTAPQRVVYPEGSSADILTSDEWEWNEPENLGPEVNSSFRDKCPALSPDRLSLVFSSNREGSHGGDDLWMCTRTALDQPWSPPINLGAPLNSAAGEERACFSADGKSLLLGVWTAEQLAEIRQSRRGADGRWSQPVRLSESINGANVQAYPWLSADGLTLIFGANRTGGLGAIDLWSSSRTTTDADWSQPLNLGLSVNGSTLDVFPCLAADQLTLLFASVGQQLDLMVCHRSAIGAAWSPRVSLGPRINSPAIDSSPCLSADGQTLYFSSDRTGGQGDQDLWVSRRVRKK